MIIKNRLIGILIEKNLLVIAICFIIIRDD